MGSYNLEILVEQTNLVSEGEQSTALFESSIMDETKQVEEAEAKTKTE